MKYHLRHLWAITTGAGFWSLLMSMEIARYDLRNAERCAIAGIWHAFAIALMYAVIRMPKTLRRPALVLAGFGVPYWGTYCLELSCYLADVELPGFIWGVTDVLLFGMHCPCLIAGIDLYCCWSEYSKSSTLLVVVLAYVTCLLPICGFWVYLLS